MIFYQDALHVKKIISYPFTTQQHALNYECLISSDDDCNMLREIIIYTNNITDCSMDYLVPRAESILSIGCVTWLLLGPLSWCPTFNSLAPGKFEWNFIYIIFKQILVIDGWGISCEIDLAWMSLDFTDDQSMLVQVMAWCRQAASHYLSQCWPISVSPYNVTRPQWVKSSHCNSFEDLGPVSI